MEVASPLAFAPAGAGSKRSLGACSPPHGLAENSCMDVAEETLQPAMKRRRFHAESTVDALSFPTKTPFFMNGLPNKSMFSPAQVASLKRQRIGASSSPCQKDLSQVVEEQASLIESYKKEKSGLESSLASLKTDNERVVKENQLLRKAVTIQQERQVQAENELKAAHQYRVDAEDKMKKLEQVILSLRYHLQAQQPASFGNDFLNNRPPDVF